MVDNWARGGGRVRHVWAEGQTAVCSQAKQSSGFMCSWLENSVFEAGNDGERLGIVCWLGYWGKVPQNNQVIHLGILSYTLVANREKKNHPKQLLQL